MAVTSNNDLSTWTALNSGNPVLTSSLGDKGIRDPSIIRLEDGSGFVIIGTVCLNPCLNKLGAKGVAGSQCL